MSSLIRDEPLTTAVLLLIFNRPATTDRVFEQIRQAKPTRLYIAADGPRTDQPDDLRRCLAARTIVERVDWKCDVRTLFRDSNLGLKRAVVSAIDWLFDQEREGIVLEDDCLPNRSFFWFCEELLERYRDDERVMHICGSNYLFGEHPISASYYFSRLPEVWGWATWNRAWKWFDRTLESFGTFKEGERLADFMPDAEMRQWFMSYLEEASQFIDRREGVWSSQWAYAISTQNGLTIVPSVNLVANIGIGGDATNSSDAFSLYANVGCQEMHELTHPRFVLPDGRAEAVRFDLIRETDPRLRPPSIRDWMRRHVPLRYRRALKRLIGDLPFARMIWR